jgi:coenzyme Q-binding protein COQ10
MPAHIETRFLLCPPDRLFDLIADISAHRIFMPWWIGARVFRGAIAAEMRLDRPHRIDVRYTKGPLRSVASSWVFTPRNDGTQIDFTLSFEPAPAALLPVRRRLFHELARHMIETFIERAKSLYVKPSPPRDRPALKVISKETPIQPVITKPSTKIFGLGLTEYAALALAPRVTAAIQPGIDLRIIGLYDIAQQLDEEEIHIACSAWEAPPEDIITRTILEDSFVLVGNPESNRHVLVDFEGFEDLARLDPRRHIALTLPGFAALPAVLKDQDLVALIPRRAAEALGLAYCAPPFATPPITIEMAWHTKRHADPAIAWLRSQLPEQRQPFSERAMTGQDGKPDPSTSDTANSVSNFFIAKPATRSGGR